MPRAALSRLIAALALALAACSSSQLEDRPPAEPKYAPSSGSVAGSAASKVTPPAPAPVGGAIVGVAAQAPSAGVAPCEACAAEEPAGAAAGSGAGAGAAAGGDRDVHAQAPGLESECERAGAFDPLVAEAGETCWAFDCDAKIDEDISETCGTDVGACTSGTSTCSAGVMGACVGEVAVSVEICDGLDNDCDNVPDDNLTRPCDTTDAGKGICKAGTQVCAAGSWNACTGSVTAKTEVCDAAALDENCNGAANEGCTCSNGATGNCGTDVGACDFGTWTCTDGRWGPSCSGGKGPGTETCNNIDDDCDNKIDEELNRACGRSGTAPCRLGTETCQRGAWVNCTGNIDPDCDSKTDEQNPCGGSLQCLNKKCVCTKNSDCPAGSACGQGECSVAYTFCDQPTGDCPPGFQCNSGSGSGLLCKPPCTAHADCPVPASAGPNITRLCYPFTPEQSYCILGCTQPNTQGGCPTGMRCVQSLPNFCGYPPS